MSKDYHFDSHPQKWLKNALVRDDGAGYQEGPQKTAPLRFLAFFSAADFAGCQQDTGDG